MGVQQPVDILSLIEKEFKLGSDSIHGKFHWDRVWDFGKAIGKNNGADLTVVYLFSYLHDSQRVDESEDDGHGERAAAFVQELFAKGRLDISEKQLEQLIFACRFHDKVGSRSDDISIQTCWDADRLDLPRVGIKVDPARLNTGEAVRLLRLREE